MQPHERRELTELLVRLSDGDRTAFDAVYDRVWPLVRASCIRWVGEGLAEDIAQVALLKVFDQASSFDPERGDALGWVLSISWWECRSARRAQGRRKDAPLEEEGPCPEPTPEQQIARDELGRELHRVMGGLPASDAEILWISATGAERGDLPPATFRKRLQRATERLRQAWRARHG